MLEKQQSLFKAGYFIPVSSTAARGPQIGPNVTWGRFRPTFPRHMSWELSNSDKRYILDITRIHWLT
jgi:hypothetical protein